MPSPDRQPSSPFPTKGKRSHQFSVRPTQVHDGVGGARSIMERIHDGDRSAMDELLREFWEPLVSYAQEIVSGRDQAEDVVQEVVLRVWERRSDWTPTDRLQAFLYRATRNEALNHRRNRNTRRGFLERIKIPRPTAPDPAEVSEEAVLARRVRAAIDDLPTRRREIFILARFHGQTHREIAEILDISPQTVSNQMSSALSQLRDALQAIHRELRGPR